MPNRSGSGPLGAGPKSGRGLGRCVTGTETDPQATPQGRGQGLGMGRGGGRGRGGRCLAGRGSRGAGTLPVEDSVTELEREAQALEVRLSGLRQKLDALSGRQDKP
ncbi:MAG: hypothetical protein H6Q00_143 [Holophagaceae bacterium]|nr:hypothetical protein [Holophagaceae bacterium]